ncbi:MAG: hypothetical protein ACR2H2_14305 [Solirubrobacteraceae bacterium]
MTLKLDEWGPMTVLMIVAAVIVLGVGGGVVLLNPDTYTFRAYLDDVKGFALAIAGLGLGRGVLGAGKSLGEAKVQSTVLSMPSGPPPAVHEAGADEPQPTGAPLPS